MAKSKWMPVALGAAAIMALSGCMHERQERHRGPHGPIGGYDATGGSLAPNDMPGGTFKGQSGRRGH